MATPFSKELSALHPLPVIADGDEVLDHLGHRILTVESDCAETLGQLSGIARAVAHAINTTYR